MGLLSDFFIADASPIPVSRAEKPGRIETAGVGMVGIHVRDCIGFGFNKGRRIGGISQHVLRLEIDDATKTGNQMRASYFHPIK